MDQDNKGNSSEQKYLHNELERRRRENIKENFDDIKAIVPGLPLDKPPSTILVLSKAKEYIEQLTRVGYNLELKRHALLKANQELLQKHAGILGNVSQINPVAAEPKLTIASYKEKVAQMYAQDGGIPNKKSKKLEKKTPSATSSAVKSKKSYKEDGRKMSISDDQTEPDHAIENEDIESSFSDIDDLIKKAAYSAMKDPAGTFKSRRNSAKKSEIFDNSNLSPLRFSPLPTSPSFLGLESPGKLSHNDLLQLPSSFPTMNFANPGASISSNTSPRNIRMKPDFSMGDHSNSLSISQEKNSHVDSTSPNHYAGSSFSNNSTSVLQSTSKQVTADDTLKMITKMQSLRKIQPADIVPSIPLTSSHHQNTRGLRSQTHPYLSHPHNNPKLLHSARGPSRRLKSFTEAESGFEESKEQYYTMGRTRKDSQKVIEDSLREHHDKLSSQLKPSAFFDNRRQSLPSSYAGKIEEETAENLLLFDYNPDEEVFY
eukprot:Sdes_comp20365_c0_seq1m14176